MEQGQPGGKTPRFFYGWIIIAVLFVVEFTSYSITGSTVSLFFVPMSEDLGWSLTQLTAAITASGIAGMVAAPVIGRLLDRYGARMVLMVGAVTAGGALLLLTQVQAVWQYWVLFGVAGAFGMGEMGRFATPVVVSKWFVRMRGRAMAIATSGTMVGGMAMVPIVGLLITTVGWRSTWGVIGVLVLLVNLPLIMLFMRRQPEDMGLLPDGDTAPSDDVRSAKDRGTAPAAVLETSWTLSEAMHTKSLWLLVIGFNLAGAATTGISYHQVPFFVSEGMSTQAAAYVLSASLLASALSRGVWGFMVDRFPVRSCLMMMASCRALGTLSLVVAPYPFNIPAFVLLWGLLGGAFGLLQPMAWSNYYGRKFQGSIQGTMRPFLNVSRLVGPLLTAILFDATDSYTVSILVAFGFATASVGLFLVARPPKRQDVDGAPRAS